MNFRNYLLNEEDPIGGPPGGGLGGPPVIPKNANVWDVLHHLLYHIPFKDDKKQEKDNSGQDKKIPPKMMLLNPVYYLKVVDF